MKKPMTHYHQRHWARLLTFTPLRLPRVPRPKQEIRLLSMEWSIRANHHNHRNDTFPSGHNRVLRMRFSARPTRMADQYASHVNNKFAQCRESGFRSSIPSERSASKR
ncbi:hypothetical protein PoB_005799800 [Plakobranchus ocellatus]|uniref:Uncharacterized protein n=1 Tax=Plakobranchus ocellatus TaxID=259542 RepID=A0AAV4CHQ6_9GAST|nr:hypothetical protein PoB_005799800 [Plakobranchus ocellatus]